MRLWPRSLLGRLTLVLGLGLCVAQMLSFALVFLERSQTSASLMIGYLARDVASAVSILERVPSGERADWLPRLARRNYRYELAPTLTLPAAGGELSQRIAASIAAALGTEYNVSARQSPQGPNHVLFALHLRDGTPLSINLSLSVAPLARWTLWVLALQFLVLLAFGWFTLRSTTRPLAHLALAADSLGRDLKSAPLVEDGPIEVARAARAFNSMQDRISEYMAERMRILAAISHDLQTPITRMRLRAELFDDDTLRDKLLADLEAMQALVQEGIAYARDGQGVHEKEVATDIDALLQCLVGNYLDSGRSVSLFGRIGRPFITRPHTLGRILTNLLDNAIKFASDPELHATLGEGGELTICVRDQGPGIPEGQLQAALQPYHRLETSRNRETGGTGLGLAIAQQLAGAMRGTLTLSNLASGGLEARLMLPPTRTQPLEYAHEVPRRSLFTRAWHAALGSSRVGRARARRHHGNADCS